LQGDELKVKVNKLTSIRTQLPYEYYSLGYCSPPVIENSAENLGEVLRGDRIENSPYVVCSFYILNAESSIAIFLRYYGISYASSPPIFLA
jgi:hypothetical protein